MKNQLNFLRFVLVLLTLPFFTISCADKQVDYEDTRVSLSDPTITTLSPESGAAGDVVTIIGTGFGTDRSKVKVRFSATEATVISVTDTEIEVEAPVGFTDRAISVRVFVASTATNTSDFYYIDTAAPSITSVTPTCFYNSMVVIAGAGFSLNVEDNIVKFGEVEGAVTEATKTSLTVVTPDLGTATQADITVTKLDMVSNAMHIDVDVDQNKVATYDWTTHTARPGVVYKTGQFTLFGSTTRRIHVLDVTLDASNTLGIGFSTTNAAAVTMCNDYNAIGGINAGYFPLGATADKDPYIRIDGKTVQEGHTSGVSVHFADAALLIRNNVASVRRLGTSGGSLNQVAAAIPVSEAENIIVCGPMLIDDGEIHIVNPDNPHNLSSTARTGLGVTGDGKRVFMVAVDTGNGVAGVTTEQLAKILQSLGTRNAMNFDGGGSTTMFVKDHGANGLVNLPSGGVQRAVRSVVYVK
ncbi:phosphodiester glycosidase family protein [Sphingobacterium hotanense]|uniref:phosphodiester glycosidase family protein n=1 Tax=Sphingobacterium hotanense TaxID=649196 RepID=UPI0021A875C4|nr:phosphodiester glycosidase family protein [Sphingobacterium hotanense]MCT1524505.1 phosphodiester glycosidase family protein [Sphingobacterium hotanense]